MASIFRLFLFIGWYLGRIREKIIFWLWGRRKMLRIAIVGDLSLQDPSRLDRAMAAAVANCDLLVHVGDIHPGYEVMRKWAKQKTIYAVPGNHDTEWDNQATPWFARQWATDASQVYLIGLDNSRDVFD